MPNTSPKYPRDLADAVFADWDQIVAGDYKAPPCPSKNQLRKIIETAYLTASAPEEGRYPQFNVVVTPASTVDTDIPGLTRYKFENFRNVNVGEFRRLAPATDLKKSAIWIVWDDTDIWVAGICDLGTSWHRARMGLTYSYRVPSALIVQIDRPGRVKIYQGAFAMASLSDGEMVRSKIEMHLFMHPIVSAGFHKLISHFSVPNYEQPRDFENFWLIALWNVFASIANCVSASGHGGMLVIVDDESALSSSKLRLKYRVDEQALRDAFVEFINARNRTADCWTRIDLEHEGVSQDFEAEMALEAASNELVEAIRIVAQFAGCDGAIVITSDLRVVGFGAEIRAELADGSKVQEVYEEFGDVGKNCDLEQFGMRHRSAIKLASSSPNTCVLVVSQDGPISGVWSKDEKTLVKKNVVLTNKNLPWS